MSDIRFEGRKTVSPGVYAHFGGRRAFTLVELLAVIVIIGVLLAISLPAVMAARERARRSACANNLRQSGTAVLRHLEHFRHFPTGGWGKHWIGIARRGFAGDQPGGWIYNVLPFLEQRELHEAGNESPVDNPDRRANAQRLQTPLQLLNCPSRRRSILYGNRRQPLYCNPVGQVARSDYAINGGHRFFRIGDQVPKSLPVPIGFVWADLSGSTGLSYMRSQVTIAEVVDGASNTYMLGEKHLHGDQYYSGKDLGDNESMYTGDERDVIRYTGDEQDSSYAPRPDTFRQHGDPMKRPPIFGSAHTHGFNVVLCDGSTRHIRYEVDQVIHSRLGRRNDRNLVEVPK